MLTLEERLAVVNLYEELGSYRAVAAIVGCDHKTVKAHAERGWRGAVVPRVVRQRATDPYRHLIRERVELTQGRVRGRRLLKVLRVAGYGASLRTLQPLCVNLTGEAQRWEPGALRYRLLHTAGRLVTRGRRVILRLQRNWPWTELLATAFARIRELPAT